MQATSSCIQPELMIIMKVDDRSCTLALKTIKLTEANTILNNLQIILFAFASASWC
jgi:hypothetical protein